MKLKLPDALHARPANLLVRAAGQLTCTIVIDKNGKKADAKSILKVLALGAAKGDEITLSATGPGAEEGLAAIVALIERNFDADLVPETGAAAAPGIAIGEAVVLDEETQAVPGDADVGAAFARAKGEVQALIASLPAHEGALFEPEIAILDALEEAVRARVAAGVAPDEAVRAETTSNATDLVADARERLLDALAGGAGIAGALADRQGDTILVCASITPSRVAALPATVRGVIAALPDDEHRGIGDTSHAAILARGRALPLAFVPEHVVASIVDGARVLLDTLSSPARVWVDPSDVAVEDAKKRRDAYEERTRREAVIAELPLALGVAVRVNVGSTLEPIPKGADGIGLLRTELVFGDRTRMPSEDDQVAALHQIASRTREMVNVRLFDAGGDKPLPWIPGDERGIALLFSQPNVLETQLRAIARAQKTHPLRILIPLVRDADDVKRVRKLAGGVPVGAMIETREAADDVGRIAEAADFLCIGTNDLTASVLGLDREHEGGDPLDPRVLAAITQVVRGAIGKSVTVCGEVAADPHGARVLIGLGIRGLSVATTRFASIKASLANETLAGCQSLAAAATKRSS